MARTEDDHSPFAHLTLEQALQVDADIVGYAGLVGYQKLQNRAEASIARVDGEDMERRAAERKKQLGVWLSQTTDEGLKAIFGRLEPGDAIRLYARIQEIADARPPDNHTADERRAAALALLGNELEAARILAKHRQSDLFGEEFAAAVHPNEDEAPDELIEESELHPSLRDEPAKIIDVESAIFKAAVEKLVATLDPALLVPVIDLNDRPASVDAYEIPDRHKRYLRFARPGSSFPWSTATERLEFDHSQPYRPMADGGPPVRPASTDCLRWLAVSIER